MPIKREMIYYKMQNYTLNRNREKQESYKYKQEILSTKVKYNNQIVE